MGIPTISTIRRWSRWWRERTYNVNRSRIGWKEEKAIWKAAGRRESKKREKVERQVRSRLVELGEKEADRIKKQNELRTWRELQEWEIIIEKRT